VQTVRGVPAVNIQRHYKLKSGYCNLIIKTKIKLAKYIEKNNTILKIRKILAYKSIHNHVTCIGCEISLFLCTWILTKQQFIRDRCERYNERKKRA